MENEHRIEGNRGADLSTLKGSAMPEVWWTGRWIMEQKFEAARSVQIGQRIERLRISTSRGKQSNFEPVMELTR